MKEAEDSPGPGVVARRRSLVLQSLFKRAPKALPQDAEVDTSAKSDDDRVDGACVSPTLSVTARSSSQSAIRRAAAGTPLAVEGSGNSGTSKGIFRIFQRNKSLAADGLVSGSCASVGALFCGPRVRMGVHLMPRGADEDPSRFLTFLEVAKGIADGADGGQIVLSGLAWRQADPSLLGRLVGEPVIPVHLGRHRVGGRAGAAHTSANRSAAARTLGQMIVDADDVAVDLLRQWDQDIISVLPRSLLARFRFFKALTSVKVLSPSLFDAPHGNVTVLFSYIYGAPELKAQLSGQEFADVLELHNAAIREQLVEFGGYECRKGQGYFLLAFSSAARAVQFSLSAQEALMRVDWPAACLKLTLCSKVLMNGVQLFNGPRLQIGMSTGQPGSIVPSELTGRADYYGTVANIAARIASAASGGQTLLSSMAWDAARAELSGIGMSGLEAIDLGAYELKGVDGLVQILQTHNQRLKMRPFRALQDNPKVTRISGPSTVAVRLSKPVGELPSTCWLTVLLGRQSLVLTRRSSEHSQPSMLSAITDRIDSNRLLKAAIAHSVKDDLAIAFAAIEA